VSALADASSSVGPREGDDGRRRPMNDEPVGMTEDRRRRSDVDETAVGVAEVSNQLVISVNAVAATAATDEVTVGRWARDELFVGYDHSSIELDDPVVVAAAVVAVVVVDPAAVVADKLRLNGLGTLSSCRVVVGQTSHDLVDLSEFGEVALNRRPQVEPVSRAVELAGHRAAIR